MASTGLFESFLGAIQASLSVLLVIFYGGLAAKLKLLNSDNTKAISKISVRMFLPALLLTKIGSQLHAGSAGRYGIVLVWAIACHIVSFLIGIFAQSMLKMPEWTIVAIMFNNTTSYPLLLIDALSETGILQSLIVTDESTKAAIERAKSYFLVYATVSSCLTFAVGPRLIDSEHAPEPEDDEDEDGSGATYGGQEDSNIGRRDAEANEQTGLLNPRPSLVQFHDPFGSNSFFPSTRKSVDLLPSRPQSLIPDRRASIIPKTRWNKLNPRVKWSLLFISDFFNAPLLGAIAGAIIGLTPALHRAFFSDTQDGGIFTAWLTASWKTIGSLFAPLPVVVAGVSFFTSMRNMKMDRATARKMPWGIWAFILGLRFILWPAASISLIYFIASRTRFLGDDPMLWFAMMLMPTGPPAMKLITLIQISGGSEAEEANISRLLTISYMISPLLSLAVVGSLKASQASYIDGGKR